jgi:hypothetical protein
MRQNARALVAVIIGVGCQAAQAQNALESQAPSVSAEMPTLLSQGWTQEEREAFWFTNQGSRILSYDIFVSLEQAGSEELFRAASNMESFRYIPQPPTEKNLDGLPIGFTRDRDPVTEHEWMGFTCAACHTSVIRYEGRSLLIDGAPTLADATGFLAALIDAMRANEEGQKFERLADRLATRVLGQRTDAEAKARLLRRLREETAALEARQARNQSDIVYGNGRLDAVGTIFNEVTAHNLGVVTNAHQPDAPVSYPFLWGTPQSNVVQWNGVAENRPPVGALTRNVAEVLGVFADMQIVPNNNLEGYPSSARLTGLAKLENQLERLWRPSWEEAKLLPALDPVLVARGKEIFGGQATGLDEQHTCSGCHHILVDPTDRHREVKAEMIALGKIGTDPRMANNALGLDPTGKFTPQLTGRLQGYKKTIRRDEGVFGAEDSSLAITGNAVEGTLLRDLQETIEAIVIDQCDLTAVELEVAALPASPVNATPNNPDFETFLQVLGQCAGKPVADRLSFYQQVVQAQIGTTNRKAILSFLADRLQAEAKGAVQGEQPQDPAARLLAYKARPLDGIWATAPYLHNGSVPTLADQDIQGWQPRV